MKPGLLTLISVALMSAAPSCVADESGFAAELTLQPAPEQPLRSVPATDEYQSLWNGSTNVAPVVQTSLTMVDGHEVEPSHEPVPVETNAKTNQSGSRSEVERSGNETNPQGTPAEGQIFLDLRHDTPEPAPTLAAADSETNEMLVRLAVWTVIILCLCVLTMLGLRRWQRRQGILPAGAGRSRVLETLAIGPGRAVSLVQLGDVRAVIGTDGSGIKTIVLAPPAFDQELSDFDEEPLENTSEHAA